MKSQAIKRRVFSFLILLCLLLVSCATPAERACKIGHHAWIDATCRSAKVCAVCGESEGEALHHNWVEATCGADAFCADCGQTLAAPIGHREDATVIMAPTCAKEGRLLYRCIVCEAEHTEAIAATGHLEGPGYCLTCGVAVENKIKNVIYIIGDGMGLEHIAAGQMVYGTHYAFTDWTRATVNTDSISYGSASALTDSAASGTALATGTLTTNGRIGMGPDNTQHLSTVLDYAKELGKKTGILTTDTLYGATPAAFSAHVTNRTNYESIVLQQLSSGVDLLVGAYDNLCAGKRTQIESNGYTYVESLEDAYRNYGADKLYAQLTLEGNTSGRDAIGLSDAAAMALTYLSCEEGFVLMIEQAYIDKFAHGNDFTKTVAMVNSLNNTVNTVLDWASGRTDTVVIVTSDHETGGLSVSREGNLATRYPCRDGSYVYYLFESGDHTDSDVGLFLWGTSFDFSTLPYMNSSQEIKNCDIAFCKF